MNRLEDLLLFVEVVEQGGFSAAARKLGLLRSKVSRRISELENRMGVRLLQRNTRNIALTTIGEQIYQHGLTAAKSAHAAYDLAESYSSEPAGLLRIGCAPTFATHALPEVLAEFCREYPSLKITVIAQDGLSELISENVDLTFRISSSPPLDSSLIYRSVCRLPMTLVSHPNWMADSTAVQHPGELAGKKLIALANSNSIHSFTFESVDGQHYSHTFEPVLACGNMSSVLAMTSSGIGGAVVPRYLCRNLIQSGALIEPLASENFWTPISSWVYVLMPSRDNVPVGVRLFLSFALTRLKKILTES